MREIDFDKMADDVEDLAGQITVNPVGTGDAAAEHATDGFFSLRDAVLSFRCAAGAQFNPEKDCYVSGERCSNRGPQCPCFDDPEMADLAGAQGGAA